MRRLWMAALLAPVVALAVPAAALAVPAASAKPAKPAAPATGGRILQVGAKGSWWRPWTEWLIARSGRERQARATLGNRQYPPLGPAPGTYVFE